MSERMKPILILPPDAVSAEDIERLNNNGICTITAKDPAVIKFLDPIPAAAQRDSTEQAAIQLSRRILSRDFFAGQANGLFNRADAARVYVDLLVKGTSLDPAPSKQERERDIFDDAKADELRRLAREEAKAERAALRAQKKADAQTPVKGRGEKAQ